MFAQSVTGFVQGTPPPPLIIEHFKGAQVKLVVTRQPMAVTSQALLFHRRTLAVTSYIHGLTTKCWQLIVGCRQLIVDSDWLSTVGEWPSCFCCLPPSVAI